MAEIAVGLLGPIIELGKCLAPPIKRQFNYLCCFNNNVKSLSDEAEKLRQEITKKEELSDVTDWLTKANQIMENMKDIEAKSLTLQSSCLALKSRYRLSKEIDKVAKELKEHMDKSQPILTSNPPAATMAIPHVQAYEFQSRKHIEEDAMITLREKNVTLLGIGGMGGLGKTTMAKKLMKRVQDEKLFDEVLIVFVGQCINEFHIQEQIADWLQLQLEGKAPGARARVLCYGLLKRDTKRIFMVVDDIWGQLNLANLGIPCDESGSPICTILLTSRRDDVLKGMTTKVFTMEVLGEEEAWSFFQNKVGDLVVDENLVSIAKQVANECKGLPLALEVLGRALKDKNNISVWKDMLSQLRDSDLANIPEFLQDVFPILEQSYKHLNDSDAKCLLLCSQFPEDSDISLDELSMYSMSLRLFGRRISNMEETRNRVSTVVERLKSRSLLLNGRDINYVKMHDVVRDVANVIAGKEQRIDASPGNHSVVECEWILLFTKSSEELRDHFVGSSYPWLSFLAIHHKVQRGNLLIIENLPSVLDVMKTLSTMSFEGVSIKSLPQTITSVKNLRMLRLVHCNLECISIIGELLGLEILVCRLCFQIKELPHEIRGLKRLKLLEFMDCPNLKRIAPGVISNLIELEEFIMWESFKGWGSTEINQEERRNASIQELESLTKLKRLWINIEDFGLVEQNICLPSSLIDYKICVGKWIHLEFPNCKKSLYLNKLPQHIICENWMHQFVRTAEGLYLEGDGARNFEVSQLDSNIIKSLEIQNNERVEELICSGGAFPFLLSLKLENLSALNKILNVASVPEGSVPFRNLEMLELGWLPLLTSLWKVPNQNASLTNLCEVRIRKCDKLQNLFFVERAKDAFLQLKELEISECEMMEEVLYSDGNENEGTNGNGIKFPKLEVLRLLRLPKLMTFGKGIEYIQFPLLRQICITECPKLTGGHVSPIFNGQKVTFGSLRRLSIQWDIFRNICSSHPSFGPLDLFLAVTDSESMSMSSFYSPSIIPHFVNLKELVIYVCGGMEKVIANEVFFENFPVLESMGLYNLPKLEEICDTTISEGSNALHNIKNLYLECLPALKHLYSSSNQWISLNNLSRVHICECGKLRNLFSWKIPKDQLLQLEDLCIESCEMMEHIFSNEENGTSSHITFSKLKTFQLEKLTSLTTLFDGVGSIAFPVLEEMQIEQCPNLISIIPSTRCNQNDVADGDGDDSFHLFCCPKVTFGSLKRLSIRDWNKISNVWCHQILPGFFHGLEELTIKGCEGIKILFSSQIAENLVNLTELNIEDCNQIEKVIGDVGEVHQHSTLFRSLYDLRLSGLPSLKMFCEWKCPLVLPSLKFTEIGECPTMEFFTPSSLRVPKLERLTLDEKYFSDEKWDEMEDLNSFIRHHHIKSTTMGLTSNEITEDKEDSVKWRFISYYGY